MPCLLRRRGREQYDGQDADQHVDGDQLGTFAVGSVLGGCGRRSTDGGDTRGSVWFSDELLLCCGASGATPTTATASTFADLSRVRRRRHPIEGLHHQCSTDRGARPHGPPRRCPSCRSTSSTREDLRLTRRLQRRQGRQILGRHHRDEALALPLPFHDEGPRAARQRHVTRQQFAHQHHL